jgi:hypothetical protein
LNLIIAPSPVTGAILCNPALRRTSSRLERL